MNVRSVETVNVILQHGTSLEDIEMAAALPINAVGSTKVIAQMTRTAFRDWYVGVRIVRKMPDSVTAPTAVNPSLMCSTHVSA